MGHLCGQCKHYGHGRIECNNHILIKNLKDISKNDVLPNSKYCTKQDCQYKHLHTTRAHHCSRCSQNHSVKDCPLIDMRLSTDKYIVKCPLCKVLNEINKQQKKIYGSSDDCCICLSNKIEVYFPKCGHICVCLECLNKLDTNRNVKSVDDIIYDESGIPEHNITEAIKALKNKNGNVYTISYGGMGCSWYIRRDFIGGSLLGLFLHSDAQGQYGLDHLPFVDKFILGYDKIG